MQNNYFLYYLLTYFEKEKLTTTSQIYHVFHGKRTPSMFYLIEINNWHHGFNQFHEINLSDLKRQIKMLEINQYIESENKGFRLTHKGQNLLEDFFKEKYYPKNINSFKNSNLYTAFWDRFQILSQVFSEYSYNNSKYIPIIKDARNQESVRQLFFLYSNKKERLYDQWYKEKVKLIDLMENRSAEIILNMLTGHNLVGKTRSQMAEHYNMDKLEFTFYHQDILEELITIIFNNKRDFSLLFNIYKNIQKEKFYGLSESTFKTYKYFENGYDMNEIASKRNIKINTVKEHLLEIAFIWNDFPYRYFVPEETYKVLNELFEKNKIKNYKEARIFIKGLDFFYYRLVELERLKCNE